MTWRVPRHVFQARAPSRNSTKYRADNLCGSLICEYFCWMLGDPNFFLGRSLPFLILSVILKNKKNLYMVSFSYFSYTIQIGSNWYMDTGVRNLEVVCFKVVLWSKNHFLFFFRFWKCIRLTSNWQNFELCVLSERLFILSVSFGFNGPPLLTFKTDR